MKAKHYYECHVTIEPVFDARLIHFQELCRHYGFKAADLLMKKRAQDTETRSKHDTFCTGRGKDYEELRDRMVFLIWALQRNGFDVWRYKIEDTLIDSKIEDVEKLINRRA